MIAHSESPFLTDLVESAEESGRFEQATPSGPYSMAVVIEHHDGDRITYAWWWAAARETPVEQSRADARRA